MKKAGILPVGERSRRVVGSRLGDGFKQRSDASPG